MPKRYFYLAPVALLLPVGFYGAGAIAATAVSITDAERTTSCGNLTSVTHTKDLVDLRTDGVCLGSTGGATTPVVLNKDGGQVNEGSNVEIVVGEGAIVQLNSNSSITTGIASQPVLGTAQVNSLNPGKVTYFAPLPGTIATPTAQDVFTYRITDGTGAFDDGTVTVTVVQSSGGGTGNCTPTALLDCKIMEWPAGTELDVPFSPDPAEVHAWSFTYDNHVGQFQFVDRIAGIVVGVSTNANDFSGSGTLTPVTCVATVNNIVDYVMNFGPSGTATPFDCELQNGQEYFLNVKSLTPSSGQSYDFGVI